ncbi:MAG: amino acid dehydrogenase [Betaproteobacteria bacterium RBG_16_64_18]|nr:MAG: amino acid dehydrogenase [Betaproteobacteria bacterium RBG_16_64_18]OGA07842.1 MAG: amino acid dehydrogenase [Betaproteobacteria bacterium RIFCSPLOWO2_02_FULL_65_20]OGA37613.1 MAG: amino acid dehydrogenase [Betaproteobacteria bacterium RIFCSPLOWO2_12_FULL_65_110]
MKVVVLGAGVVGIASAWYLARAGHEVTVLDRQAEAGLETSFANGGQISVSHAEPWANPTAPLQMLQWLGREDAPLLFRPRADLDQWLWGARFLIECLPARARRNTEAAFALASYSRDCLRALRRETGIHYDESERGILHIYTARGLLEHAHKEAALLRARGFDVAIKSADECVGIEPALAHAKAKLYGGVYAVSDESGDAHLFTQRLAALAREQGVQIRFNVSVNRIELDAGRVSRVVIDDEVGIEESVRADAFVVALGSYSRFALRNIGISLPIYPVKGYSITIALEPGDEAPSVSLTDHERKIVISRLGDRLRVAGTAELAGYDTEINEVRCQALVRRCFELFPNAGKPDAAQYWTGLRPATPSNLPIIGRTRFPNLYLNTGHGTLGWTMACGAGQALADIVCAKMPAPNFRFLGVERN